MVQGVCVEGEDDEEVCYRVHRGGGEEEIWKRKKRERKTNKVGGGKVCD